MRLYITRILLFFPSLIQAQALQNSFIYPQPPGPTGNFSQNLVWELGKPVTIRWISDFPTYNLMILQNNNLAAGLPGSNAGGVSIGIHTLNHIPISY
jgi:hypothetical protein